MGSVVALVSFSGEGNAFCSPIIQVTTLSVSSGVIPFSGSWSVEVTNGNALTLGSTNVVMEFDPSVLQALGASSATLSNFIFNTDNVAGTVATASAAFPGDELGAGDEFFTVEFETTALPGTSTSITVSDPDVDECGYYYLAGPVPPIPPVALRYSVTPGLETVGVLGDVDCDGNLTPIDASVVLGLFVGGIVGSDLPTPCNDPDTLLAISDWDLSGTLTPIDASVTLAVFVDNIYECDTTLGQIFPDLCPTPLAASSIRSSRLNEAGSSTVLRVSQAQARPGRHATVEVKTQRAIEVGSSGLALSFDASALRVVSVESSLDGFTYHVEEGVIRTASAGLGQSLAARDVLVSVVFKVTADAAPGRYAVDVVSSGVRAASLSGPVAGGMPDAIGVQVKSGAVRVLRGRNRR
jgi:hypothetical protein